MQFQLISLGFEAATYLKKYSDRFLSMHRADSTADKAPVAVGSGVVDWRRLLAAGVQNYLVEMELREMSLSYLLSAQTVVATFSLAA